VEEVSPQGGVLHVHCECALIHHLGTKDGSNWDNVPPFNYIGVSKLSCSTCHLWVEALNDQGGRKFYTRGSHGKWYWPWVMPEAGEALKESLAKKVSELYIEYEVGRSRTGTDSTDTAGAQPRLSAAQEKSTISRFNETARQFGDNFYAGFPGGY